MENPRTDKYGTKKWYNSKGELHRLEGPAVEWLDGCKAWYVDGKRHRLDGPAWERDDGSKQWYVDGNIHRLDGPACEWVVGCKEWYVEGKRHRLDGPAVEWDKNPHVKEPPSEWWVDHVQITEEEYPQAVLLYKCKMILES